MLYRILLCCLLLLPFLTVGQCPQFFDQDGNLSSNPQWRFCDDAASTLNIQSDQDLGAYTIDWGDGNTENGPGLTAGQILSHNYPAGIQTYTITITVNGCTITGTYVKELPVKASIEVPPDGVTQVCAPGSMDFLNNSTGNSENTTYFWDFGDGETLGPLDFNNAQQTVTHTYQPGTVTCDTRVTLIAENVCSTRPSEATFEPVQIWDLDLPGINASPRLLCWPDNEVTYTNETYRNCSRPEEGNTFQRFERWTFHDFFGPGLDSIIEWRPWPPSPARTVAYPGPGTYSVTLEVRNFCGESQITTDITIIDEPEALFSLDLDTICVGQEVTMTKLTGAPANRFRFTTGESGWANFGNQNTRTFTYSAPGDYMVGFAIDVANATPSCKDTVYLPLVVLPDPIADFDLSEVEACGNLTVAITEQSVDAISWEWDFGNGTTFSGQHPADVTYNAPGDYDITLTTTNAKGCSSSQTQTVSVYALPEPDFNGGSACLGQQYDFFGTAVADSGDPIITWDWDFGDGITAQGQNVNHIYFNDGPKNVTLTVQTANCSGQISKQLQIESLPVASFAPDPSVGCAPFSVNFINTSNGANKFYWDFDDGNIDSVNVNPSNEFFNSSGAEVIRDVQLVAVNNFGCTDTFERAITVRPEINADFDYLLTDNCESVEVQFRNLTPNGSTFLWDFGDGSPTSNLENPLHEYVNNSSFQATYTVTLTVTNAQGCSAVITQEIEVNPAAIFGFEGVPDAACTPAEVIFQAEAGAVSYEWDFGDGTTATGQIALKTFVNNGQNPLEYDVTLRAVTQSGCVDVVQQTITVYPKPTAQFSISEPDGCSPLNLTLTNNSVGASNYIWNYGDGQSSGESSASHSYIFENLGSSNEDFTITLEVISDQGCRDTAEQMVTVFPGIAGQFTGIRNGCSPLTLDFAASGGDSYNWDFGNGNTGSNANEQSTFFHDGTPGPTQYVVRLEAISNNACNAFIQDTLEVYPLPTSGFTVDETQGCTPLQVNFIPQASGAVNYIWLLEQGVSVSNTGAAINHEYINSGTSPVDFTPSLIVENANGCRDTSASAIRVYPPVRAQAAYNDTGCAPMVVNFFNVSAGASSYVWDFQSFGNSSQASPQVTFFHNQSSYTRFPFSLTASSVYGCTDVFRDSITLYPRPVADFDLNPPFGCQPLEVDFLNNSQGGVSYRWDYGFGERDTESNLNFSRSFENITSSVQERPIQLITTNTFGCHDTIEKSVQVYPEVEARFDEIPDGCSPHELTFVNESDGADRITWTFSDQTQSTTNQTFKVFNNTDPVDLSQTVQLVATNTQGCTDTLERNFTVYANPIADFTSNTFQRKFPDATFAFSNLTAGNTWAYEWAFGDGNNADSRDASNTYETWGSYPVQLVASSDQCADSIEKLVVVQPPAPVVGFEGGGTGCRPLTVTFVDTSRFANNYFWDFGDGGSSPDSDPSYTYYNPGVFDVTLTVTGPDGTAQSVTLPNAVEVYEKANAYFTSSPSTVFAEEDPVDFINLSTLADYFYWDFGDGTSSEEEEPTHFYERPGIYDVTLIADNFFGCPDTFIVSNGIEVIQGGFVDLPNAFTPNPNGPSGGRYDPNGLSNDVFFAFNKDVESFRMEIFSRWGERLFETNDINIGWDGYSNGELCQQDVYVYKVIATFEDGTTFEKIGDVTLLR